LVISSIVLGVKIVYTKYALKVVEPGKLILWHNVIGMVLLAAYSVVFEEFAVSGLTNPAIGGLLYQGLVVAGFCFATHAKLLKRHSASRLSVFSFATPLFGVAIAFVFRGDPLSPWLFVSGLCVAIGILLVNTTRPAKFTQRTGK
jgi:drug/metabolite transporter (DMT)-like permease